MAKSKARNQFLTFSRGNFPAKAYKIVDQSAIVLNFLIKNLRFLRPKGTQSEGTRSREHVTILFGIRKKLQIFQFVLLEKFQKITKIAWNCIKSVHFPKNWKKSPENFTWTRLELKLIMIYRFEKGVKINKRKYSKKSQNLGKI